MSVDPGLCRTCRHTHRVVSARGSTFWRCTVPSRRKYPPLPVLRCRDYSPVVDEEE